MGKPYQVNLDNSLVNARAELTLGSETSQYQQEKKTIVIPLVAASETGGAQTQPQNRFAIRQPADHCKAILGMGVIRLRRWQQVE